MSLIKLVVCISVLVTKVCFAGLTIKTSILDKSSLVEASIDILESCYADRFTTVGLAGPSIGTIMTKLSSRDAVSSVTLIDETSKIESNDSVDLGSRYRLQVFMIATTNQEALVETLTQVKKSKWWNHMASFLLIDLAMAENECANAAEILLAAWKMNLLNSKFICLHRTRGRLIYNFNPYTTKAPVSWHQENTYKGINDHPWTLFSREYRENESRCDKLDFDKTIDLGGYEVRAAVSGMEYWWSPPSDDGVRPFMVNHVQNLTAEFLMSALNATWKLQTRLPESIALIDLGSGNDSAVATEITSGISDVGLNIFIQPTSGNFVTIYPLYDSEVAFVTQRPGYKSKFQKFISVLDRSSRFGVFLVLLITLAFFKFCLGRTFTLAIMDLVLIVCNAGLNKIPQNTAPRIYLCSLFILVVTIQGIYQGQFASLLTTPVPVRTVETIEDLARSNHSIYGPPSYGLFFDQSVFEGRYVPIINSNCVEILVLDRKDAACVNVVSTIIDVAWSHDLHRSRETIGHMRGVYLIRPDWPLEERVNIIFGKIASGALVESLYRGNWKRGLDVVKFVEQLEHNPKPEELRMEDLTFAFIFLGIGLVCAAITFVIEVIIFSRMMENPRRRTRR